MAGTDDGGQGVHRLDLRLVVPGQLRAYFDYPVVQMLIDGKELLASAGGRSYIGSPPAALLGGDVPLLPASQPRRVVLYIDTTGAPEAGSLAPLIARSGNLVTWTGFQHVMDMDEAPVLTGPYAGSAVKFPDLEFDARQYIAEVQRATAAREWESPSWQTALLLDHKLSESPWELGDPSVAGLSELGWVEPDLDDPATFRVTIWDGGLEHGSVVTLRPSPGPPDKQAHEMAEFLTETPADRWPITERIS